MWSPEKLVHCLRSLSGSTWSHMEESCGKKWDIGHLQILLRHEVRRKNRSILTRESLTSSDWDLWELRFFWRKTHVIFRKTSTWYLLQGEHVRQESLQQQDIIWGKNCLFLFFNPPTPKEVVMEAKLCVICEERRREWGRRRAETVCGKVRGRGGLKAREDEKDKTSISSHFHVFALAHSLLKMRKINSNLSSTK